MNRARNGVAATLVIGLLGGGAAFAGQAKPAPPDLKPILAGKKFTPPLKGQADIELVRPTTKREKDMVVTTIEVKNVSNAPIARLTVDETWYDKGGNTIPGGKATLNGLLQPGEVQTLKIETPYNAKMSSNNWNFSHANGPVKPHMVKSLGGEDEKKEPATKKASAKKK